MVHFQNEIRNLFNLFSGAEIDYNFCSLSAFIFGNQIKCFAVIYFYFRIILFRWQAGVV